MPTVDGIHRSPLWPPTRPEVIAINEIERNHWPNVQEQRGRRKEGPAKCSSLKNALLSDLGIVLSHISLEHGDLPLLPNLWDRFFSQDSCKTFLSLSGHPGGVSFSLITCLRSFVCLDFRSLPVSLSWWVLIFFYKGRKKKRTFLITIGNLTHAAFWKWCIKLN